MFGALSVCERDEKGKEQTLPEVSFGYMVTVKGAPNLHKQKGNLWAHGAEVAGVGLALGVASSRAHSLAQICVPFMLWQIGPLGCL